MRIALAAVFFLCACSEQATQNLSDNGPASQAASAQSLNDERIKADLLGRSLSGEACYAYGGWGFGSPDEIVTFEVTGREGSEYLQTIRVHALLRDRRGDFLTDFTVNYRRSGEDWELVTLNGDSCHFMSAQPNTH